MSHLFKSYDNVKLEDWLKVGFATRQDLAQGGSVMNAATLSSFLNAGMTFTGSW